MSNNNKKKNTIIDALSYISDSFIDKATAKRIEWKNRAQKTKKKPAFAIIPIAAALVALLMILTVVLITNRGGVPTDPSDSSTGPIVPHEKQIPIYTGMSVSGEAPSFSEVMSDPDGYVAIIRDGSSLCVVPASETLAGTYRGKGGELDHKNPFPEGQNNVIEKVDGMLTVTGTDKDIYYAKATEDVYITVHVSNPDSFEILSFTLNGTKYADYMFEKGSNLENLILKVNVGEVGGVFEYTLDNIKYVDGTEIKDVRLEGDRTVKIGVYTENLPTATVKNTVISPYGISADISIIDNIGLIEASGGKAMAVLFDGNSILDFEDLASGENSISFDGLVPDTLYQLSIVAKYDDLSGEGVNTVALYQEAFYTDTVLQFANVDITQTGLSFAYSWIDPNNEGTVIASALYHGNEKIRELSGTETVIDGLLSNNTYRIATVFSHNGKINTAEIEFTTKAKTAPTYAISTPEITQTSVSLGITETDKDNIGEITEIRLSHANGTSFTKGLADTVTFGGLLSNNSYTVTVTYTYDLNDGTGVRTKTVTKAVKTKAKTEPTYAIGTPEITQTSVSFGITETDKDNIGTVTKIELLHGTDAPITATVGSFATFKSLLSNNDYTIKVTYTYDLNDGTGVQTKTVTKAVKTKAKTAPTYSIVDLTRDQTSIGFGINETDIDGIGSVTKIELLADGSTPLSADIANSVKFTSLSSATKYTVRVTYTYDLNDGNGVQTKTVEQVVYTPARTVIVTDMELISDNVVYTGNAVTMKITLDNPDNVTIKSFTVNGVTANATLFGSGVYLVNYTSASTGGKEYLACEEIAYTLGDEIMIQNAEYTDTDELYVLGEVTVTDIRFENEGTSIVRSGESHTVIVTFKGSELYDMQKVNNYALTKIDETTYSFSVSYEYPSSAYMYEENLNVTSIVYGLDGKITTVNKTGGPTLNFMVKARHKDVIEIRTVDDLMSIDSSNSGNITYVLMNDIDLAGIDWEPIWLGKYDCLDGNGYAIKNMTVKRSITGDTPSSSNLIGLFSYLDEFSDVMDLRLENAKIEIITTADTKIDLRVGLLTGYSAAGNTSHCYVEGSISCFIQGKGSTYIGGVWGGHNSETGDITNCYVECDIACFGNTEARVGGVAGYWGPGSPINTTYIGTISTDGKCDHPLVGGSGPVFYPLSVGSAAYADVFINDQKRTNDTSLGWYPYSERP